MIVFALASLISLMRILVSNKDALSNLVWAEDGLFPLCTQVHGYVNCLVDPYEGYFLLLSRTLALPVSLFPQSQWPLVTNIVAALSFGFLSALITWLLIRAQLSRTVAIGSGIAAVMLPIVGLETINTAGSAYMLLLVVAAISVSFPFNPRLPSFLVPTILLITATTIPSAVVLLLPLSVAWFAYSNKYERIQTLVNVSSLCVGLVIQFSIMVSAQNPRSVVITIDSIQDWLQQYPTAILAFIPTVVQLDEIGQLDVSFYDPSLTVGIITLVAVAGFVTYLLSRRDGQLRGAGLLIISGFLVGFIPAISNYPINRYYVVPMITLVIAIFIWVGSVLNKRNSLVSITVISLVSLVWLPDFGASKTRTEASPVWSNMLLTIQDQCAQDPSSNAIYVFTPNWPFADADFKGPTSNTIECSSVE